MRIVHVFNFKLNLFFDAMDLSEIDVPKEELKKVDRSHDHNESQVSVEQSKNIPVYVCESFEINSRFYFRVLFFNFSALLEIQTPRRKYRLC